MTWHWPSFLCGIAAAYLLSALACGIAARIFAISKRDYPSEYEADD